MILGLKWDPPSTILPSMGGINYYLNYQVPQAIGFPIWY